MVRKKFCGIEKGHMGEAKSVSMCAVENYFEIESQLFLKHGGYVCENSSTPSFCDPLRSYACS